MSKFFIAVISLFLLLSSVSCTSAKEKEKAAIDELIKANAASFEKKDVEGYIATLDPESPEIANTKEMVTELFSKYDLKVTVESVRILTLEKNKANVEVVQVTEKIKGSDFRNNRVKIVHHLKKIDGKWKIGGSDTIRVEYFDQSKN